jgi:hypothetical protein
MGRRNTQDRFSHTVTAGFVAPSTLTLVATNTSQPWFSPNYVDLRTQLRTSQVGGTRQVAPLPQLQQPRRQQRQGDVSLWSRLQLRPVGTQSSSETNCANCGSVDRMASAGTLQSLVNHCPEVRLEMCREVDIPAQPQTMPGDSSRCSTELVRWAPCTCRGDVHTLWKSR